MGVVNIASSLFKFKLLMLLLLPIGLTCLSLLKLQENEKFVKEMLHTKSITS